MNEETMLEEKYKVFFKISENFVAISFKDNEELLSKIEDFVENLDTIEMINENLMIRKKYRNVFRVKKDDLIFLTNIEEWKNYDKVALTLLSKHPFPTERSYVWKFGFDASTLRNVIYNNKDDIYTLGENLIGLTKIGKINFENKLTDFLDTKNSP